MLKIKAYVKTPCWIKDLTSLFHNRAGFEKALNMFIFFLFPTGIIWIIKTNLNQCV